MKVIIIEDEKVAASHLENMINELDAGIEIIGRMQTVRESVSWLSEHRADLIFLDIQLSDGLCFKIFEQVEVKTPIIFTTAYDQYAVKAFEVNSIDYLLKPIRMKDLQDAVNKYRNLTGNKEAFPSDFKALIDQLKNAQPQYQRRFAVQAGSKIKSVEAADIAYFYVIDGNTFLSTLNHENYGLEPPLDKIEALIDPAIFFRINRQFIINIKAIKNMFTMSNRSIKIELNPVAHCEVLVSLPRLAEFKKWINQ